MSFLVQLTSFFLYVFEQFLYLRRFLEPGPISNEN